MSLALGEEVASRILALRVDDGSQTVGEYTYTDEVGYELNEADLNLLVQDQMVVVTTAV